MDFITNTLKENMMPSYCLQTQKVQFMKLKQMTFMKIFYEDKNLFDFSDYLRDSKFFDLANKKVIGKMKDEFRRKIISEYVVLKSQMYSVVDVDGE